MIRKAAGGEITGKKLLIIRLAGTAAAGYGLYAFIKNRLALYMFLKEEFVFFDFNSPSWLFFIEYIAIMGMFVFIAHYGLKLLQFILKKRVLKLIPAALAILLAGCSQTVSPAAETTAQPQDASVNIFAMDTVITVEAHGGDAQNAVGEAEELIYKLEGMWSVTDENSEIYRANHSNGNTTDISMETQELLEFALQTAQQIDGAFEPTIYPVLQAWGFTTGEYQIPDESELSDLLTRVDYQKIALTEGGLSMPNGMELDLGAIAKGYTGDLLIDIMRQNGVTSGIINLGGNVSLIGKATSGELWRVGIRSPFGDGNIGVLEAEDTNIITSGVYERYFVGEDGITYGHILDPTDGKPVENDLLSVTIVGKEGRLCDALSTAMFVKGLAGATDYWRAHDGFDMILVTKNNEIYVTEKLEENFSLTEYSQGIPVHVMYKK